MSNTPSKRQALQGLFWVKAVTRTAFLASFLMIFLKKIDIESLRRDNHSLADAKLKTYDSNVILKVKTQEGDGYLFLLLEHQNQN